MNENNYLVQFVYAGKEYQTHLLSHNELETNVLALENSAVMAARNHIKSNGLEETGGRISRVAVFFKGGKLIYSKSYGK